jgi:hypothetical protein
MLPHPEYNGRPPQDRTQHLIFTMGERGKSELQMATQIIRNCPQIGSVSFIINQTDDETRYGLLNGKVQPFKCKDIDETIQWGEYGCT